MILKKVQYYFVHIVLVLFIILEGSWFFSESKATENLLEHNGKEAFDLFAHWSQGNVVALIRHAERCDRSENECLEGESGITIPGKEMSIQLGKDFKALLPLDNAMIYNSPVKRTAQTAHFMFGNKSTEKNWITDDCKSNLLEDIFQYKKDGQNMVLILHSTCIGDLSDTDGNKLIEFDTNNKNTYGITIFLALDKPSNKAHVLGYLYPEDWQKLHDQEMHFAHFQNKQMD